MAKILIVEPDAVDAASLRNLLGPAGHESKEVSTVPLALRVLEADHFDLVIAELKLLEESGVELLDKVKRGWPGLPVVMVAAKSTVVEAVDAMKRGAAEFLQKPFAAEEILYVVNKVLTLAATAAEQPPVAALAPGARLLGQTDSIIELHELIRRAAAGMATVLVRGESGTGKELVARALHDTSRRRERPFVKIDCASLPDTLLESELFGYERGAFTGAVARKPGRVELADGGTLFLDEIGEVSPAMQAKLLRLLQDRAFERLGGRQTVRIDVRFVLATHRDLETMVQNGSFRQDLFYRLNVVPLWLPPLRARRDDIELLAKHFCSLFASRGGRPEVQFSPQALRFLRSQRWPGNVRQLENFVERLVVLVDGALIGLEQVEREFVHRPRFPTESTGMAGAVGEGATPNAPGAEGESEPTSAPPSSNLALDQAVRKAERDALLRALARTGGNRSVAARVLGVSRATLYNKLKELGIDEG